MYPAAWSYRVPWGLLLAAVVLMALGWLGVARSEELADGSGHYLQQQIIWSLLAAAVCWGMTLPSYRALARHSYALFACAIALLIAVYFFPTVHGTHRWIRVGHVGLQPSEFAKLGLVLVLARYLTRAENYRRLRGLIAPLALTVAPLLLVLREPDLGTSLVFLPVLFVMLYAAGARKKDLAILVGLGVLLAPVLWTQMSGEQKSRVTALFEQGSPDKAPSDDGYHLHQAKQVLALGGVFGSALAGEAVDDRAVYQLPEDHTDFIFIILLERFGWLGAVTVLGVACALVWQALAIAANTREPGGRLIAIGLATLFGSQVFINTAMTVGLLPVTGLSLPLVSYGGSGLLANALAIGLLVNIAQRPGFEMANAPFRFAH